MTTIPTIQLRDFCKLFEFEYREVRFVLEQGFVPKGVEQNPSTGNRREFGPAHAFWLAILLHLKKNGMKTGAAAEIAGVTTEGIRSLTQNFGWDPAFLPMKGQFKTEFQYFLEIGDREFFRLITNANPSKGWEEFPWRPINGRSRIMRSPASIVTLRLNISQIARVLAQVEGWSGSG